MTTRLLITDMDGTVVDSMPFLRELAIALVAADEQPENSMRALYDETFGKPIGEQFHEWNNRFGHVSGSRINAEKMTRLYEAVHRLAAPHFPMTDFGRSLSTFSRENHPEWRFALVTSTHRKIVDIMPQIRNTRWDYIGGFLQGLDKRGQIIQASKRAGVHFSTTVYVGDSPSDQALAREMDIPYFFPNGTLMDTLLGKQVFTGSV